MFYSHGCGTRTVPHHRPERTLPAGTPGETFNQYLIYYKESIAEEVYTFV